MNLTEQMDQDLLLASLPEQFDFYHLGSVKKDVSTGAQITLSPDDQTGIAFSLQGEMRGVMLILIDRGLDIEAYLEMGNILASRWAQAVSITSEMDVMISPPHVVEATRLEQMLDLAVSSQQKIYFQNYSHIHGNQIVKVQTLILPHLPEETAYA